MTCFPNLLPPQLDQSWFPATDQLADEAMISQAEDAYETWKLSLRTQGDGILPYGESRNLIMMLAFWWLSIYDSTLAISLKVDESLNVM